MSSSRPLPAVIGATENALRAMLTRVLASTLVPGYPAWVVLNTVSTADSPLAGRQRAAEGLASDLDEIDGLLAELGTCGLVDDAGVLTSHGAAVLTTARAAVAEATRRLVEGIDETEQETARRVLDAVRRRAGMMSGPGGA